MTRRGRAGHRPGTTGTMPRSSSTRWTRWACTGAWSPRASMARAARVRPSPTGATPSACSGSTSRTRSRPRRTPHGSWRAPRHYLPSRRWSPYSADGPAAVPSRWSSMSRSTGRVAGSTRGSARGWVRRHVLGRWTRWDRWATSDPDPDPGRGPGRRVVRAPDRAPRHLRPLGGGRPAGRGAPGTEAAMIAIAGHHAVPFPDEVAAALGSPGGTKHDPASLRRPRAGSARCGTRRHS